jgi:hypothetical protein
MLTGLRFRPAGWVAAIGTLGAMAATMVIAAPGGAAAPEKEFTASFKQECVIGPGSLNQKGTLEVQTRATGPESVSEGESVEFHNGTTTITVPAEPPGGNIPEPLLTINVHKVRGKVGNFELNGIGLTPAVLNIAKPAAFPEGLPYEAPVEEHKPTTFTVPHEGSYSLGPYIVTGKAGENAVLEVGSEPGFKEVGAGEYEATGKGMVWTLEGVNETGGHVIGPLPLVCTAPKGVVLASIRIGPGTTTPTTGTSCPRAPEVTAIEPAGGTFGTTIQISGCGFEGVTAVEFVSALGGEPHAAASFTVNSPTSITAAAPVVPIVVPMNFAVIVTTKLGRSPGGPVFTIDPPPVTSTSLLVPEYNNWVLSGSITDKKLDQAITLPAGSTFNGHGVIDIETGGGSVNGNLAMPAFTTPLKLFGVLTVELGMTLTPEGSIAGRVGRSETISGDETLSVPVKLGMGITSVSLLGLKIPTACATAEPLPLSLVDNLTREELIAKGWSFAGSTTIPKVKCEGGLLGGLFGAVLSTLLSGPENAYAIKITAPGV